MHERLELLRRSINVVIAVLAVSGGSLAAVRMVQKAFASRSGLIPARVLEVRAVPAVPHSGRIPIVAHGTVRAGRQVDIVPQVSGELRHVHRDLAPGKIIAEGELLFEIDPTVYELRVRQVEAEIQGLEANLARQKDETAGLDRRIRNAEELLAIRKRDYRTSKQLRDVENIGTQRGVDLACQTFLRQSDVVAELEGLRALIPYSRRELEAKLDAARAKLRQARYVSEQTRIVCPFRARVEAIYVHESEVVTAHFAIARLTELEAFEIAVGIDLRELRWLEGVSLLDLLEPGSGETGPEVQVRWSPYGQELTWRGRVARIERVDEITQTARMIVEVRGAEMLATVTKGEYDTTGLAIGMFCKVELPGQEFEGALAVPREALVDNRSVYVFERDPSSKNARIGRLRLREVPILRTLGELVLVDSQGRCESGDCGLKAGELVVLPPLDRVVPGMRARLREERVTTTWASPSFRPGDAGKTTQVARLLRAGTIGVE